jgi:hypothetical protein
VIVFAGLLPLLVLIGLVVLVVRLASGHDRTTGEGAGAAVRDVFQYLALLVTLVLSCLGLVGLFSEAVNSSQQITRDTGAVARSISFLVVGLPAFIALAFYTRRRLRDDLAEARSAGWAIYLTLVLFGSLVVTVAQSIELFGSLLAGDGIDWAVLATVVVWGAVWIVHSWVATREGFAPDLSFEHILGSFVGLVTMVGGGAVSAVAVLVVIYDAVFDVASVGSTTGKIVRPLVACAVGAAVWAWYWLRATLHEERSFLWIAYVLFAGVLSGVVMVAAGVGTALFNVLDWIVADPSGTAATHFEVVPAALGVAAVGVANWVYHRYVFDSGPARARTDVDRLYDYLLAAVGLVVTAGGIATLITYAMWAVVGTEITGSDRSAIAVALTLLIVGAPLWGVYWARAQRARKRHGADEIQATIRRIYVFSVLGITGLVALVSLIVLVYLLVRAILDGNVGAEMFDDMAVPIALVATTGAVAGYHFTIMREDRATAPKPVAAAVRYVILITEDGADLRSAIVDADMRVRVFPVAGPAVAVGSVEDAVAALTAETHENVVVLDRGEDRGFEVIPLR